MKNVFILIIVVAVIPLTFLLASGATQGVDCGENDNSIYIAATLNAKGGENDENVTDSVDDLLGNLNLTGIQGLIDLLTSEQLAVFGFDDIVKRVRAVANGEYGSDFGSIISYVFALFGADVFEFLPMLIGCLAIVLAYNLVNSVKGRFASEAIERVVYFATGTLAVSLVVGYFSSALVHAVKFVASVKTQINAVSPVLITLMTAAGASSSAGVYTPTGAVLGGGMTSVIT
ncbi:MAG: hypothetical protein K2L54_05560, partial [Clostridiales bacterium]|nr:hypothetical protein [Clostridiales bacterium]